MFTGVPAVLTDWNADWGADGGNLYFRGYQGVDLASPAYANPVLAIQGQKISLSVGSYLKPALASSYDLFGFVGAYAFSKYGILAATVPQDFTLLSATALPAKIDVINDYLSSWQFVGHNGAATTTYNWLPPTGVNNKVYVLWGQPLGTNPAATGFLGTPTIKRVQWAVEKAQGATTLDGVVNKIWERLANGEVNTAPPFEPNPGQTRPLLPELQNDWKLLDSYYCGDCDDQARLMVRVLGVLGVPSNAFLMRASLDTTDVFNVETKTINNRIAYLVMDFDIGAGYAWNNFEGVCNAGSSWYAVWPPKKANTALDLFHAISFQQYWVYMTNNKEPGQSNPDGSLATVEAIADPNPVTKP